MRRGEVWWVQFTDRTGGEVRKSRPAIIVSNDAANEYANRVQVVPLSRQTAKLFPCEAKVTLKGSDSKAMADQIMTVSKERLSKRMGIVSAPDLQGVERVLRIQLNLGASS